MKLPLSFRFSTFLLFVCLTNPSFVFADSSSRAPEGNSDTHHRLIVLSDIEADPDDTQSFVRLLLYSNSIDIEGMIATTSTHLRTRVAPESIRNVIQAYGFVRDNLNKHEEGFPSADDLLRLVKQGLPIYGMSGVGEGRNSEGSDWIIHVLEENDDRPVWISVWGGSNTLAQALFTITKTKSEAEAKLLISKLRVYTISDQDDSGIWIRTNYPDLFYIVSPGGYGKSTWTAIHLVVSGINNEEISNNWLARNIQQGHGPLGAMYPDVAYGMEGDTPSWLNLCLNGLSMPEHPDFGGWGGRYELYCPEYSTLDVDGFTGGVPVEHEPRPIWTNAVDTFTQYLQNEYGRAVRNGTSVYSDNKVTLWRWREDFQNDFAARMDWCLASYDDANHPPVPVLASADTISVKAGQSVLLDASATKDPDGDSLCYLWFQYAEAGSYKGVIPINGAENLRCVSFVAPKVEKTETVHFILKVTDRGQPPLSRYKRVIVIVAP